MRSSEVFENKSSWSPLLGGGAPGSEEVTCQEKVVRAQGVDSKIEPNDQPWEGPEALFSTGEDRILALGLSVASATLIV